MVSEQPICSSTVALLGKSSLNELEEPRFSFRLQDVPENVILQKRPINLFSKLLCEYGE